MKIIKKRGEVTRVLFTSDEERKQAKEKIQAVKSNAFFSGVKEVFEGKTREEKRAMIVDKAMSTNMKLSDMIDLCRIAENFNQTESLKSVCYVNSKIERFYSQSRKIENRFYDHCAKNREETVRAKKRNLLRFF